MNSAYITVLSALCGSVLGGVTTGSVTWMSLRSAARTGHFAVRQDLFRDFIVAASSAYGHALVSNEPQIQELVALYAMISQMRMLCSPRIVACADEIMRLTVDTNLAPNKTIAELRDLIKSEQMVDPLREFAELARHELQAFAL